MSAPEGGAPPSGVEGALATLFEAVVDRPVATWMVAIAAAVFGFVSWGRLPLDLMPDLAYPTLTVRTEVEGYAPEEVESQISRPIEEALATTQGLVELESRSRAGLSDVVLEFAWGTDMDAASQSVRERLQTTFLPEDAERPLLLRYDPSQAPILRLALAARPGADFPAGEEGLLRLREVAERDLKRNLEALDGIAAVRVRGGLERVVRVEAEEDWLAARGVTLAQLAATLGAENINLPGGAIRDGDHEYLVRTLSEVRAVEEISALEIRRADGVRVPVGAVARVTPGHEDREVVSRLDGEDAVVLEVFKAADANIVRVAGQLRGALYGEAGPMGPRPGLTSALPAGLALVELEDQARFIESAIANLNSTAVQGALLAVLVLFLFLRNLRATAIIAVSIPLSVIVTFAPMYLGGVSLNLMSLGGLALGVGMLVDNAVVVLENIQVHQDRGAGARRAAVRGTAEVAAAVTASTMTTVAVFLPITFVEGVAGQVFGDLALAVVFSLLASLVVALFFVPMLAARDFSLPEAVPAWDAIRTEGRRPALRALWGGEGRPSWGWRVLRSPGAWAADVGAGALLRARVGGWRGWVGLPVRLARAALLLPLELAADAFTLAMLGGARPLVRFLRSGGGRGARLIFGVADAFSRRYERAAAGYESLMQRAVRRPGAILGAATLALVVTLPLAPMLGQTLIPELHQGRFVVEMALPVGTTLSRTADVSRSVERAVKALPSVAHVHALVGTERDADSRADEGEHTVRLAVELRPTGGDVAAAEDAAMVEVRDVAAAALPAAGPAVELRLTRPSLFSVATPVEVLVYDGDLPRLRAVSARVVDALRAVPGLTDVKSSLTAGYPEVQVVYDRALLARLGLDTGTVARQVRDKVLGSTATRLSRGDGKVDLKVRLVESDRRGLAELERINVNPRVTPPIPLAAVARFSVAEGPSEIRRIDQRRAVAVTANLSGFDIGGAAAGIAASMRSLALEGAEWELGGQNREMQRSTASLQLALGLAIFLVYVIMAATFESVLHPLIILVSVPLAVLGVLVGLFVTATPVSVVVLIGAIVLAGVVVNNAIVLVDTVNRLRVDGMARDEAVWRACGLRLRPILITTLTTVLGLVPLALGIGDGAELQQPLAITVIAGLSSSTLLTLAVIPAAYLLATRAFERPPAASAAPAEGPC